MNAVDEPISGFVWRMLAAMVQLMAAEEALHESEDAMTPDEFKQMAESVSLALNQCRIMLDLVETR
jgi:hypothetical protein